MRKFLLLIIGLLVFCFSDAQTVTTTYIIRNIIVTGNSKTYLSVILRELPTSSGDTVSASQINTIIETSRNNLIKTSLFNFVDIDYYVDSYYADILINLQERWYFWPYPILEHAERNLSSFLHNLDMNRINYGIAADIYNINGKAGILKLKLRLGYKEHYLLAFHKNGFGQQRNSSLRFQIELFRQKSVESAVIDNLPIYTSDDKVYIKQNLNAGVNYSYRPRFNYVFNVGIKYKYAIFKNNILFSDVSILEDELKTSYLNPYFNFNFDSRNNKIYPVSGTLFDLYCGENRSTNYKTGAFTTFGLNVQFNKQIARTRLSYRSELSCLYMIDYQPKSVLFSDKLEFSRNFWIRGYELFYFVGNKMLGLQNTLGIKISDFRIHRIASFLPDKISKTYSRIYLDIFYDFCWIQSWSNETSELNQMNDKFLYSTGIAINLETYYDRLLRIYIAYIGYSGKIGIFVNYKTPLNKLY